MKNDQVVAITRRWVQDFVVKHNLCPFAAAPLKQERIRIVSYDQENPEVILEQLSRELTLLSHESPEIIETSIVVAPNIFPQFLDYNQYLDVVDALLVDMALEGTIQVASFHPKYQFADLDENDVRNYTNRSPFPMFHLIREDSIENARNSMDVEVIPQRNMALLLQMGEDEVMQHLEAIMLSS